MFENLTRRFTDILGGLTGSKITEKNDQDTMREIRRVNLAAMAKMLTSMSDAELRKYLAFVESPSGQWYRDARAL